VYLPGAVTAIAAAFRSRPDAVVVYGDALGIDADGRSFNVMHASQYSLIDLMSFNIICQQADFMHRSVLEQVHCLNPPYRMLMDHLLWMNIVRLAPLVHVPQTWAAARYHDQAKNRRHSVDFGRESRELIDEMKADPKFAGILAANERRIMADVNRFDRFYLTDAGQSRQALQVYARAFSLHPRTSLRDWKHILLALLGMFGLKRIRGLYDRARARPLKIG
jgi:hypothetical protein